MNPHSVSAACIAASALLMTIGAAAEPLPLEVFASHEATKAPVISPDGRYLALIASVNGRRAALVRDLKSTGAFSPVVSADTSGTFDLEWCYWANDTRLACGFRGTYRARQFVSPDTKIVLVDADGKNLKESLRTSLASTARFDASIAERIASDVQRMQVRPTLPPMPTQGEFSFEPSSQIFHLELGTGVFEQQTRRRLGALYTDGVGNLRLAASPSGSSDGLQATSNSGESWTKLAKTTAFSKENPLTGLRVVASTGRAYGYALQDGRKALWDFDLEDKAPPRVAFAHPEVDVGSLAVDDNGALYGVNYETDRPRAQYVDEKVAAVMRAIDKALPDAVNRIESMSKDRAMFVIGSRSDIEAARYYLYDAASRKLSDIGASYPNLDRARLARMSNIEYVARDGTKIPAYLTKPLEGPRDQLPLIVMPHSGYEGRSHWAYDTMTQFLANRGYAVISMNYRGSAGYGAKWLETGARDWDGVVYNDIIDAARWAISQGIADARRICIVGRGYSGYIAFTAAIREEDLFKCAIGIGGRTDVAGYPRYVNELDAGRFYSAANDSRQRPDERSGSPARLAAQARIPLLIIHGTEDTKSPVTQSEEMAKALESAGKAVRFVKIERADYSFWRESERATVLKDVQDFLAEYLGNRPD